MRLFPLAFAVTAAACLRASPPLPPPEPPPPSIRIPAGCARDLGGAWVHKEHPDYRYQGTDDGGTLVLLFARDVSDGGIARVVLERGPKGFVGSTHALSVNGTGQLCPVEFPTEVMSCPQEGLVLLAATDALVDDACRPVPMAEKPQRVPQPLVRPSFVTEADGGR